MNSKAQFSTVGRNMIGINMVMYKWEIVVKYAAKYTVNLH